jgi:hypothetical protein
VITVLIVLVLLAVLGVAAVVLAVALGARAIGRDATKDLALLPGLSPKVPPSWHGSHDPEARLWRRLRDAVRGVQASDAQYLGAGGTSAGIEHQAVRVEEQLIAVSRIARSLRPPVVAKLENEVATIERLCAEHISQQAGLSSPAAAAELWARPEVAAELDAMSERLDLIAMARQQPETDSQSGATDTD